MLTVAEVATRCNKKNNVEERAPVNTLAKISRRSAGRNKTLGDTLANVKVVAVVEKKIGDTLCNVKAKALVDTLDETLPVTDAKTLGDTVGRYLDYCTS